MRRFAVRELVYHLLGAVVVLGRILRLDQTVARLGALGTPYLVRQLLVYGHRIITAALTLQHLSLRKLGLTARRIVHLGHRRYIVGHSHDAVVVGILQRRSHITRSGVDLGSRCRGLVVERTERPGGLLILSRLVVHRRETIQHPLRILRMSLRGQLGQRLDSLVVAAVTYMAVTQVEERIVTIISLREVRQI